MKVCEELGLKMLYEAVSADVVVLDHIPGELAPAGDDFDGGSELERLIQEGGQVIEYEDPEQAWEPATPVHWVTRFPQRNAHNAPYYGAYGNEMSISYVYGFIGLIVTTMIYSMPCLYYIVVAWLV